MNTATLPAWIEAIATVGALLAALAAFFLAWRTHRHERNRSRLELASGITAWWVHEGAENDAGWGVLVVNTSASPRLNVKVAVNGNNRPEGDMINIKLLPPGRLFFESRTLAAAGPSAWKPARGIADTLTLTPLTMSEKQQVTRIEYSDVTLASRWTWTPSSGLRETSKSLVPGIKT